MILPEQAARETIDAMLADAGWTVQSRAKLNLGAARGVVVREFALKTGFADYLLFVDCKAIGAVEAKPTGTTLSGIEAQSEKYGQRQDLHGRQRALPVGQAWQDTPRTVPRRPCQPRPAGAARVPAVRDARRWAQVH